MNAYHSLADDYYVSMNLSTEMEISGNREAILHYFEQMQKKFPELRNFYAREKGDFVLEADKEQGSYRWCSVEARRICSGYVNPPSVEEALKQHSRVLELVPYALSISPLDCESLNIQFGFDFMYRGNHNQLLVEALGMTPAYERLIELTGATTICYEPAVQLALDPECRTQIRMGVETRTNAYHVRTGDFPEEHLSVYLTARRYGSLDTGETFVSAMTKLAEIARSIVDSYMVENVLRPLQQTIAIR